MTCRKCKKRPAVTGQVQCDPCRDVGRRYQQRLRRQCVEAYGGCCECCGATQLQFLAIDHINERGAVHRNEIGGSGRNLYSWLKRNKYPPGFRVLCHNCNFATFWYGECPCAKEAEWT